MTRRDGGATTEAAPPVAAPAIDGADRFAEPEYRLEGVAKVTGVARYVADLKAPGMLWAAVARSPIPHGRIVSVDASAARAHPGVHAVIVGADVRPARIGRRLLDWPVLAWDRVRFIGDRVAAVAADTPEAAFEAASKIRVEYDELPYVLSPEEALAPGAPVLHDLEEAESYAFIGGERRARPHPNVQGTNRIARGDGDIDAVFGAAAHVFEHTFHAPRQYQGHLEPHATLVQVRDGATRVRTTNKTPFLLQKQLALTLGIPAAEIDVESRHIGGDFGGKGLSLDEYVCWYLARATGRPIKAVMSLTDDMRAANPRHSATITLRTATDAEGRFLAHQSRVLFDGGAYAAGKPAELLVPAGGLLTLSCYRVPHVDLEVTCAYTNTVPGGNMRAPGEPQALFASESHVDMIAATLGVDPLELRLRNALRPGDMGPTGVPYAAPRAIEVLETLRSEGGWGRPLPPNRGRGIAIGVRRPGGGKTALRLRHAGDGTIEVVTGAPDQGGGTYTLIRRVTAAALSVDEARVRVLVESTLAAPTDAGIGASRGTYLTSRAIEIAARELRSALESTVADRAGLDRDLVRLVDDHFELGGDQPARRPFAEALEGAAIESVEGVFDSKAGGDAEAEASFVGYLVEVEVDPETGAIDVHDVLLVADAGTVINPLAHRGQMLGGYAFGLGSARMEELRFDDGNLVTLNLNDYKLPTAMDVPRPRVLLLPPVAGSGAYGAKAVGELTNSGVAPAIANAVAAAVGARVLRYPLTAERVLAALDAAEAADRR